MNAARWWIVGLGVLGGVWWVLGTGSAVESEADKETNAAYHLVYAVLQEYRFQLTHSQIDVLVEGVRVNRLPSGDAVRDAAARMSLEPFTDPAVIVFPDRAVSDPPPLRPYSHTRTPF